MKRILIIPNQQKDENFNVTESVAEKLRSLGAEVYLAPKYSPSLSVPEFDFGGERIDAIVVIGGDGSVIDASVLAVDMDIPLLGVNLGTVGYLSEVEIDDLDILSRLFSGDYRIEERMLLCASKTSRSGETESCDRFAVNDIVISHDAYFGISDFKVENARGDSVNYRADGVIVATPTGSTAYSLSAGGPIVAHNLDLITVTPVCPHSLFNRSIVYGSTESIKISNHSEEILNVSIDGRLFTKLSKGDFCEVKKATKHFKVITFTDSNMFSALFKKINNLEKKI